MKLKKSKYIYEINLGDYVIWGNEKTGRWFKLATDWMNILNSFLSNEVSEIEFMDLFEEKEDKEYFKNIVSFLREKEFIIPKTIEEVDRFGQVYIAVTNTCNLHCSHCCYNAETTDNQINDLSTQKMKEIFDKAIAMLPDSIVISGGEPLVRKDIMLLLEYLRNNYQGKIILATNALLIDETNVNRICDLIDGFDISLDGVDEETCSKIRGKGVFDKVIEKIKLIRSVENKYISLSMVDVEKNDEIIQRFLTLNNELKTEPVIRYFYALGRGADLAKKRNEINADGTDPGRSKSLSEWSEYLLSNHCGAGRRQILIDYDGKIYPCGMLIKDKFCMGNIFQISNLAEYVRKQKFSFESLKPWNTEKCNKCDARMFCYNCLGEYEILKENDAIEENLCIRKENIIKIMEAL